AIVRLLEAGLRALIGAVEEVAPCPFEVEAKRYRLPHARVAKLLAPLVDGGGLHRGQSLGGEFAFDHLAGGEGRKIVSRCPDPRGGFLPIEDLALLERFEAGGAVLVELDSNALEIVLAAIDRKILAPIVG